MRYFPIAIMVIVFAASAFADPATAPSLPGNSDLGNAAVDSFRHGIGFTPQLIDNAMLPDGLTRLPAMPAKTESAVPVGHIVPSAPPMFHRPLDWYAAEIAILSKSLAADPMNVRTRKLIQRLQHERDNDYMSVGDFDTAHERQLRQAPGLPNSSGEIGLRPGDF